MRRNSYLVFALLHLAQTYSGSTPNGRPSNPTKKSFGGNWRTQIRGLLGEFTEIALAILERAVCSPHSMCWLVGLCDKLEKECGAATRLIEFANTFACHRNTNTACIQMLCVSQTCRARHMTRHINTDIRLVRAFPLVADQFEKKERGDYWGEQCINLSTGFNYRFKFKLLSCEHLDLVSYDSWKPKSMDVLSNLQCKCNFVCMDRRQMRYHWWNPGVYFCSHFSKQPKKFQPGSTFICRDALCTFPMACRV